MDDLDCYDALCELQRDHTGPHKDAHGETWSAHNGTDDEAPYPRRLARVTVDVLLPAGYSLIDVTELSATAVTLDGQVITDVIDSTVVEARLVTVDDD